MTFIFSRYSKDRTAFGLFHDLDGYCGDGYEQPKWICLHAFHMSVMFLWGKSE